MSGPAAELNPDATPEPAVASTDPQVTDLAAHYRRVRRRSLALAAPLSAEDAMVQSMADASPAKWHLGHTTWFFERFLLASDPAYVPIDAAWDFLFNSYYESVGPMHARAQRGVLSRPALADVFGYRDEVDARLLRRLEAGGFDAPLQQRILLGLNHEQQHQELLLTDIKHAFWCNPLKPAYRADLRTPTRVDVAPMRWAQHGEALIEVGAPPWPGQGAAFAYDNESPRHRVLLHAHALANRPVTNAEYRQFIDDGGYRDAALWLSDGWARINAEQWSRPLYWDEALEREFTLGGMREIDPHAPVCHLSYFEADAFARWAGARLPTEFEWEHAAAGQPLQGNFVDGDVLHPASGPISPALCRSDVSREPSTPRDDVQVATHVAPTPRSKSSRTPELHVTPQQLFGDVWEWTSSPYTAYPGFREMPGALGEYNGKFMNGQQILRGGSCATPGDHLRASYRNFFHSSDRWQFSGLRLARDA